MTLFKLSLKNIKKSIKDYTIYFFTLIFGVAIFYIFNAIETQTVLMNVSKSTYEIIDVMNHMLSGVSVFVSFILGFLIIYANRFLMKRRNAEFGIYLVLGMSKRKISLILFFETLCIGFVSLAVGLGIGVCLSQLMSILVSNMFEADMTKFEFVFSSSAFIKTLLYFGVMYILVMIFNTFSVNKCKLIDLLSFSKKSEQIKMKNPWLCVFVFIVAVCMLAYAYYLVSGGLENMQMATDIFVPIILGCVSTFLIFWSLSGFILKIAMGRKRFYYKGLNSFTLRQVSSKVNTTVFSMTLICLMLFVTICVLSSSLSIKNSMTENLKSLAPADVQLIKPMNINEDYRDSHGNLHKMTEEVRKDSLLPMKESLKRLEFDTDKYFKDVMDFYVYATNELTISDTLGDSLPKVKQAFPLLNTNATETIVKLSDYNELAKYYGLEPLSLRDDEYAVVADFDQWVSIRNDGLKMDTPIHLSGKTYHPKYKECKNGFLYMNASHVNMGVFVVPDQAVKDTMIEENVLVANYNATSKDAKKDIEQTLLGLSSKPYAENTILDITTKLSIYEASVGLGAMVTFIGLYLGIIFLISSAAILALKDLSESTDNKERYNMIRKLGADERMMNKSLFRQIAIFFLFPLVLALIHSIFGILFCNQILLAMGSEQMLNSVTLTVIFLVIIYGGYFIITYVSSKNIIKER